MIARGKLELSVAASPIWIRLRDTFTGATPKQTVRVRLERETDAGWIPLAHRHRLSADGDLAFVNLGRTHAPGLVGTFRVRVTVTVDGCVVEAPGGGESLVAPVTAWSPDAPSLPSAPTIIHCFPGPAYAYPPGTAVLHGRVTNNGAPVARAAVTVDETIRGTVVTEAVRTDTGGHFRLPLRWSDGATVVSAAHGASAGQIQITLPADLSTSHEIPTLP